MPVSKTHPCDQIYTMNPDGTNVTLISPVLGRTTCSFVLDDGRIVYSATLAGYAMIVVFGLFDG